MTDYDQASSVLPRRDRSGRLQPQAGEAPCGCPLVVIDPHAVRAVALCETVPESERPESCKRRRRS